MRWVPNPCRNMAQGSTAISSRSPLYFRFPHRTSQCRPTLPSPALLCLRPGHAHSIAVSLIALRRLSGATTSATPPEQQQVEAEEVRGGEESAPWDKVSAVLFDMDGVLCNSVELSRMAAVDLFADMGVSVTADDFIPFTGTGEANFLGGVASMKGVKDFDPQEAKKQFLEIYVNKYAKPNLGIGYPGALEFIIECKRRGLKVAITSSADRTKVDANLAAANLPVSLFDVIISADAFKKPKPAPDIFLAASKSLDIPQSQCIAIESALAGVEAAKAAKMRCIAVTTTISEVMLQKASPSLVRKDIGSISIDDILHGCHSVDQNKKVEETREIGSPNGTSSGIAEEVISGIVQDVNSASEKNHYHGG
ncbi:protein SUPPRESSOR OF QUENCHING 1, chloroplastic-like isoform X2 [Zingiber officinale]|uniref:protein SUPPRESSOR OF QUENCHING 1, chloroplastic-like isoform X2 n=1 Tax=Zingiber officinale TaxID=94328 RepID=UPI001C4D9208|nr:protein SUPPRESSOR OF QUENCHING 1, chloroplastic-like isoform X2 [Zingiber officinale]